MKSSKSVATNEKTAAAILAPMLAFPISVNLQPACNKQVPGVYRKYICCYLARFDRHAPVCMF